MELSVIILNYNASVFLELCVDSVFRATQNINAEIIVADNDSTDDSIERLAARHKNIKILRLDDNYGFSKGNNIAVERATGTYICLVNPDVIISKDVFEKSIAFAKANSQPGFLGIQLIDGAGEFLPESKRRIPKPWNATKKLLGFSSSYYDTRIDKDQDGRTDILVGAFLLGKRLVYLELGGLDERYFMYGEDIDLSYTALKSGFENYYLGSLKGIHFKGESTMKDRIYKEHFYGAMSLFYVKHYPRGKFLSGLLKWILPKLAKSDLPVKPASDYETTVLITNSSDYKPDWADKVISGQETDVISNTKQQIVFDLKTVAVHKAIQLMLSKRLENSIYRFLTEDRSAFAGSDSSQHRGEMRKFK